MVASMTQTATQQPTRSANERLRILVVHQHYWPEIAATAQILTDLCEDLVELGHHVTVVCGQPSYRQVDKTKLPARELHRGVHIHRVWSYVPSERTIPKRLLHYGSYFASSLGTLLTSERPDVCFVMSTPPLLLGVSGALTRLLRGVPFVYSVQDLYPDIAVHLGVLRAGSLQERLIEQVARRCYKAASALVTLSPGMAGRLAAKGIAADRIHVIPNWADTSSIQPVARDNPFARAHGLAEGFVVQYSGNLGLSQGLESILEAASLLRSFPITFALVGDGNARPMLEAQARERALDNVRFLPPQPRERLSELLGSCDVGLVSMKANVAHDLVPSKLYGIMAAARPVLASVDPGSEAARVVEHCGCGWVVPPEDPEALARGIRRSFEASGEERTKLGQRGRAACEQQYSRSVLTRRYASVLQAVARPIDLTAQRGAPAVTQELG
jgi:colanic acid biosynthesis glycosyl transferase WcaI